jgi:hypothetical protein
MALTKIPGFGIDTSSFALANANITGNLTAGNANLGNLVVANFFSGNGSLLTSITGSNVTGYVSNANNANYLGNVIATNYLQTTGTGSLLTSITGGNVSGQVGNALLSGTVYTNAQPNITSVGTLTSLNVTGNIIGANIGNSTTVYYGNGYNLTGVDSAGRVVNGTSNLSIASSGGNITMGVAGTSNVIVISNTGTNISGYLTATGNITGGNANLGNLVKANYLQGDGSLISNIGGAGYIFNGTSNLYVVNNGNITGTVGSNNTLVITSTGVNVLGYTNVTGNLSAGNLSLTGNVTSTLNVTGNTNVGNLNTNGTVSAGTITASSLTLSGNLIVGGTTTYVNSTVTNVVDPMIELGGGANGALLTAGDGKDRGLLLHRYEGTAGAGGKIVDSFIGYSNTAAEFIFASNATVTSDVVTVNSYGNVHGNYFIGNGSQLTGIAATTSISLLNGSSNVIVTNNGNVGVSVGGTSNVVVWTTTGEYITGNANVTGNITAGNSVSANYFVGSGQYLTGLGALSNGSSNISIVQNGNVLISAAGSFAIIQVTQTGTNAAGYLNVSGALTAASANITGNLISGNAGLGNAVTANYFTGTYLAGTLTTASQPNITTVGTLNYLNISNASGGNGNITSINANLGNLAKANYFQGDGGLLTNIGSPNTVVLGTSNINIPNTNGNIAFTINGNANVAVFTGTGVNIAGYLTTTGNITSGNANLGNLLTANYVTINNNANITGNLTSGNASLGNLVTANYFTGIYANGNSSINIPSANGNVNINSAGISNVVVITGTGANITGTANVSGNLSSGNLITGNITGGNLITANYVTGTLTTSNQLNITSLGNLLNVTVTNTANIGGNVLVGNTTANVLVASNGSVVATGNITAANANLGNTVTANYTNAVLTTANQPNITNIGTLGNLTVTNNVSMSTLTTGTGSNANLTINPDGTGQLIIDASTPLLLSGNTLTSNGNIAFSGANVTLGPAGNVRIAGGTLNQYLKTDGSGNLSWGTPSGGGGGGTSLTYTAAATPPGSANTADQWYNTTTSTLYEYLSDGTSSYWIDIQTPTVSSGNVTVAASGSNLAIQLQGTNLTTTANTINFVGGGDSVTASGNVATVNTLSPFLLMGA